MERKNYIFAILFCAFVQPVCAQVFSGNIFGTDLLLDEYSYVQDSASIYAEKLIACDGCFLQNDGIIYSDINVGANAVFYVENRGEISGDIIVDTGAKVVQIIKSDADITSIGLNDSYDVLVQDANKISWNKLLGISGGAGTIRLNNSDIIFDVFDMRASYRKTSSVPNIVMNGDVSIYLESGVVDSVPIMSNIHVNGELNLYADNLDSMYALRPRIENESLYVSVVRETDYGKVLKNKIGEFLNGLRSDAPNDGLLTALDAAKTMPELNAIMARSVRINPIKLMDSVRTYNLFEIANITSNQYMLGAAPVMVYSDNMAIYGIDINSRYDINKDISAAISLYGAKINYSDDINNYNSVVYGGNVHIQYVDDLLFARAAVGATFANFDISSVFNGNNAVNNPSGFSLYAVADIGTRINITDDMFIAPFVRFGADYASVLKWDDADLIASGGAEFLFNVDDCDLQYDYGVRASIDASGMVDAGVCVNIWSDADMAGATLNAGIIYNDFGLSYLLKVGAGFSF